MSEKAASSDMIAFWIGEQEYCIPVASVREIRSWTPTTQMPHAPSYMIGIVNLRGSAVPILDLAARFGYVPAKPTPRHAIMIAEEDGQVVGLLVDGVSGIMAVRDDQVQATPPIAKSGPTAFIQGLLSADNRLISLVSLRSMLEVEALIAA